MGTDLSFVAAFDLETTGVSVFEDRIVTASILVLDPIDEIVDHYEWLVNPGIDIPEGATNVHGITTEHAQRHGSAAPQAVYEIAGTLAHYMNHGVPVVAYNAAYDFSLLDFEIRRHLDYGEGLSAFFGGQDIPKKIIDPFVLDRKLSHRTGSRKLTDVADYYGVVLAAAHRSYDDCFAAAQVAKAQWEKHPVLREPSLEELYDAQAEWYAEQQISLSDYFKRIGKAGDFSTDWPIRKAPSDEPVPASQGSDPSQGPH